ncbi:MAG: hypothetical protein RIQ79_1738 [Verrucomicrobiota bacterium]|jgi:hypothetical protein
MKLFLTLVFIIVLAGGAYFLFVDRSPPVSSAATTWSAEAQVELTTLLSDLMKASQSNDWKAFDADLDKADAHLAKAPADADTLNFRTAISSYRSQQQLRAQLPK